MVQACNPSPDLQAGESGSSRSPSAIWCIQIGQPELLETLSQNEERKEEEVEEIVPLLSENVLAICCDPLKMYLYTLTCFGCVAFGTFSEVVKALFFSQVTWT